MATTINGDTGVSQIQDDTVTTAKVDDSQITNALMADDAIGIAELSATGTASSSTFLRGDNAWAAPSGGGTDLIATVNTTSGTSISTGTIDLSSYKVLLLTAYSVGNTTDAGVLRWKETSNTETTIAMASNGAGTSTYITLLHDLTTGVHSSNRANAMPDSSTFVNPTFVTVNAGVGVNTGIDTATTDITFNFDGGQTFNLGTIKLYGLK